MMGPMGCGGPGMPPSKFGMMPPRAPMPHGMPGLQPQGPMNPQQLAMMQQQQQQQMMQQRMMQMQQGGGMMPGAPGGMPPMGMMHGKGNGMPPGPMMRPAMPGMMPGGAANGPGPMHPQQAAMMQQQAA